MQYQHTFKRYELKYMLTVQQAQDIREIMLGHMSPDDYGITTIRNLYYDTSSYRLIRHSMEHPVYKEKLRLRTYQTASQEDDIFVELKKKYKHVVYKRRLTMPQNQALCWLSGNSALCPDGQIGQEIEYFRRYYGDLTPAAFLSYRRQAWYSLSGDDFRVTFDWDILSRRDDLLLSSEPYGAALLDPDHILMEIKTSGAIPLWMTHHLTHAQIYKTSFSKYGTAYRQLIYPKFQRSVHL